MPAVSKSWLYHDDRYAPRRLPVGSMIDDSAALLIEPRIRFVEEQHRSA